jgi:hypothetical protein
VLYLCENGLTSSDLAAITLMIESTQLNEINFLIENYDWILIDNLAATQEFINALNKNATVSKLQNINRQYFPEKRRGATMYLAVYSILARNNCLNQARLLLLPPPTTNATAAACVSSFFSSNQNRYFDDDTDQNLSPRNCEICPGSQQCWRQCHFQTLDSTSATIGKAPQTASSGISSHAACGHSRGCCKRITKNNDDVVDIDDSGDDNFATSGRR